MMVVKGPERLITSLKGAISKQRLGITSLKYGHTFQDYRFTTDEL